MNESSKNQHPGTLAPWDTNLIDKALDRVYGPGAASRIISLLRLKTVTFGLMLPGTTGNLMSIVRALGLDDSEYDSMSKFTHSGSADIEEIKKGLCGFISESMPLKEIGGHAVLIVDATTQPRDARRMPCAVRTHQSSRDMGKRESVLAQIYNGVGICVSDGLREDCALVSLDLLTGSGTPDAFEGRERMNEFEAGAAGACHLTDHCAREGIIPAKGEVGLSAGDPGPGGRRLYEADLLHKGPMGVVAKSLAVFDRGYYKECVLAMRDRLMEEGLVVPEFVIRCNANAVCHGTTDPGAQGGRGRRRVEGGKMILSERFNDLSQFRDRRVGKAGSRGRDFKVMEVTGVCWGASLHREVRFVLACEPKTGMRLILMTTDFSLPPELIVEAYLSRFDIEFSFDGVKNYIGCLDYSPWSKSLPRLPVGAGNQIREEALAELNELDLAAVSATVDASRLMAQMGVVAYDLLLSFAYASSGRVEPRAGGRTRNDGDGRRMSVARAGGCLSKVAGACMGADPGSGLSRFIEERRLAGEPGQEAQIMEALAEVAGLLGPQGN